MYRVKGDSHRQKFLMRNALALSKRRDHVVPTSKRARGPGIGKGGPFLPTEDWYEPRDRSAWKLDSVDYRVIMQRPGKGYVHAVTEAEIRERLSRLPKWMTAPIDVIQLSQITRKKMTFPCYGMQWGTTLYLYPIESTMIEEFSRPPRPAFFNEAKMYGGIWEQLKKSRWQLRWSPESLKDFYLNNILIHELGHLLDDRNTNYHDRERYAEWFALEHGYKASDRETMARRASERRFQRRHHSK